VNPIVLSRPPHTDGPAHLDLAHRVNALDQHQRPDHAEESDIGQRDDQIDLSELTQKLDQLHAEDRANYAANEQN